MGKVVVVEDNKNFLELEKELIETFNNAKCEAFLNPLDAIEYIIREKDVSIVVTDYEMPNMNGFELATKILTLNPEIRIIVCSGHDARYLERIREAYSLSDKIEIFCKSNIGFLKSLV